MGEVDTSGTNGVETDAYAAAIESDFSDDTGFGDHLDGWETGRVQGEVEEVGFLG